MNEKGADMQSEDVEEAASTALDDNTTTTTMTFTDNQESISPKNQAQLITSDIDSNTKFFYQNFDDDIEKVEVSSNESTTDFDENDDDQSMIEHKQNESIKTWLQKISDLQKRLQIEPTNSSQNIHNSLSPSSSSSLQQPPLPPPPQQQQRVVKYQDLPYMGEMTLDNSKPRRGRKPKKADICHLIYKNYGTIFPGTPNPKNYLTTPTTTTTTTTNCKKVDNKEQDKSDVQNRIISSLLEKRLTQEINNKKTTTISSNKTNQNEPLNLCIRDLNHLKIRFMKKSETEMIKTEPQSDDDIELIESPTDLKTPTRFPINSPEILATNPENGVAPGGYVYWPNAGVFIHPMALQQHLMHYQRMTINNNYTLSNHSPRPPPEQPPTPPQQQQQQELRKLVPKVNRSKKQEINDETEFVINETKIKRNIDNNQKLTTPTPPTKRKRSAIFIPPIQTDNTTNPATEVSICKFKFTGGAKPQLQEKKMLSVDSGGNFRYYSGTGDKSMRGYEFFPRETLQQQINNNQCSSSTGAFLQASGERIYTTTPPATATTTTLPQQQLDLTTIKPNCDFLLSPEIQPDTTIFRPHHHQQQQQQQQQNKKRKSRKSLQREKLEQTFKEKGFLIQTQQLESAEGATYCKFRQLRKFTRYLFRSWKDYLPGNVRELQENSGDKIDNNSDDNGLINGTISVENDDNLSRHSSEFSNVQ